MSAAGHAVAVHGWAHRPLPLRGLRDTSDGIARARDLIGGPTGTVPRPFRPPHGVMTAAAYPACRRLNPRWSYNT